MDNSNFVQLQLQKQEESAQNQLFESSLKGVKGDEFYFGMKDGDPLKFIATEVTNQTKMNNFSGKIVTTVSLLSEVKNEDLPVLKDALTGKIIDAIRIKLENGVIVEQSVKEKRGNKMMEKAVCFFNFQQENGSLKSEKVADNVKAEKVKAENVKTENVKSKLPDKDNKSVKVTTTQKSKPLISKTNDDNITKSEEMPKYEAADNGEQFEGVWTSETKKRVTLTITKINSTNYEVKQISKIGFIKNNVSPCPTFELINGELICKQFKIIYLPESSSIYFDGAKYKKE